MSNTFKFKILTPNRIVANQDVTKVFTKSRDGEIEFLSNHMPIIVSIDNCVTTVIDTDGNEKKFFTSKGVLNLKNKELNICCDAAESSNEIDFERAEKSKERAEKRLSDKDSNLDIERALRSLKRANERLKLK